MKRIFFVIMVLCVMAPVCRAAGVAQQEGGVRYESHHRPSHGHEVYAMCEADYDYLYDVVKKESFSDNKVRDIRLAALGCWFTCEQVAGLLKLISFSSDKLKALEAVRGQIVDKKNVKVVTGCFTFSSDRERAMELVLGVE
ncbi:MAG: DUF4476 domain-containing protein [Muribaculaceae bacterium]